MRKTRRRPRVPTRELVKVEALLPMGWPSGCLISVVGHGYCNKEVVAQCTACYVPLCSDHAYGGSGEVLCPQHQGDWEQVEGSQEYYPENYDDAQAPRRPRTRYRDHRGKART